MEYAIFQTVTTKKRRNPYRSSDVGTVNDQGLELDMGNQRKWEDLVMKVKDIN